MTRDWRKELRAKLADLPHPIIMDVGSGGAPLPIAHIIVDLYPEDPGPHRNTGTCVGYPGQLFVMADVEDLPFDDGSVDFIWCCCLLEHVNDPIKALAEMCRVSKQGALLIPTVELEGLVQMNKAGAQSNGHHWLCRTQPSHVLEFMRCDTSNKVEVRTLLQRLGAWPIVRARLFEAAIFMGWGWNGWPDTVEAHIVEPTDENIDKWLTCYQMGPDECPS